MTSIPSAVRLATKRKKSEFVGTGTAVQAIGLLIAVLSIGSGCATNLVTDLTTVQAQTPLSDSPCVPVRCASNIALRDDQTNAMGIAMRWNTGKVYATHFCGGEDAEASIELLTSNLDAHIEDIGFTGVFSYSAEILLHTHGERHVLRASFTRNVHGFEQPKTSVKIVVETVVADLARQVEIMTNKT